MMRRSTARTISGWVVVATACALPWAYGGVRSWAWRPAATLLVVAFAVWTVAAGGAERLLRSRPRWFLPAALAVGWAALQLVPLPRPVLSWISPATARWIETGLPGFGVPGSPRLLETIRSEAEQRLPQGLPPAPSSDAPVDIVSSTSTPRWHALSLAPSMTADGLFWYVGLLAAAVTLAGCLEDERLRRPLRLALFGTFAALALVGAIQLAAGGRALLWFQALAGGSSLGPYVNGSHFAGVMEMAVPWMAAYALARWSGARSAGAIESAAVGAAAVLAFAAGLAGQSKMAAATMSVATSVVLVAGTTGRARWRVAVTTAAAWLLGAGVLLATPAGGRLRDFLAAHAGGLADSERLVAWKAMLPAVRSFWLTGTGYGTFRFVAQRYLPAGDGDSWLQLHNDWLESVLSGGAIGAALLVSLIVCFALAVAMRRRAAGSSAARAEQVGILAGMASLSVHALVDFNHQIPANALLFVVAGVFAASGALRGVTEGGR